MLEAYCSNHKKKSQGSRLRTLILSGDLVPTGTKSKHQENRTAWKTSFRGHKAPSVTPKPITGAPDLLTSPRPHEFHSQALEGTSGIGEIVHAASRVRIEASATTNDFLPATPAAAATSSASAKVLPSGAATSNTRSQVRTHMRSRSDATGIHHPPPIGLLLNPDFEFRQRLQLGDIASGRAFDNGCQCYFATASVSACASQRAIGKHLRGGNDQNHCTCGAPRLQPQLEFLKVGICIVCLKRSYLFMMSSF